jgi:hypothetical protein
MALYAGNARQGLRHGANAIRRQKEALWSNVHPVLLEFSEPEIRWSPNNTVSVTMQQTYRDSIGYAAYGTKTLRLAPVGTGWHILNEDWRGTAQ